MPESPARHTGAAAVTPDELDINVALPVRPAQIKAQ